MLVLNLDGFFVSSLGPGKIATEQKLIALLYKVVW
jgi:hypothetical protein